MVEYKDTLLMPKLISQCVEIYQRMSQNARKME